MHPRPPFVPKPRHLVLVLVLVVLCAGIAIARFRAPAPGLLKDGRVAGVRGNLTRLLGDGAPRPLGSAENAKCRERLVAAWREVGIEPEIQKGWVASRAHFAQVQNVVAVLPGRGDAGSSSGLPTHVMVAAHYDSVGAGPGASDDLLSVAIQLRLARELLAEEGPRPTYVFLTTDGEELGLLGARLFCAEHPLRARITRVVNLEARGTSGPSLLFETAGISGQALAGFAERAQRPLTSSLFVRAYEQLPNDTDFTVFKTGLGGDEGCMGMNFAFTGSVQRYHTPLDTLEFIDDRSLVHHYDNARSALRALAQTSQKGPSDAGAELLWSDWAGCFVVGVTRRFGEMVGLVAVAFGMGGLVSRLRRRRLSAKALLTGLLGAVVALTLAVGVAFGFVLYLRATGSLPGRFVAGMRPIALAGTFVALASSLLFGAVLAWRIGFHGVLAGVQALWYLILLAALLLERFFELPVRGTELLPLLVPPLLVVGTGTLLATMVPKLAFLQHAGHVVAVALFTLLVAPVAFALPETLGVATLPLVGGLFAFAWLGIAPYAALAGRERWFFALFAGLLAIGCTVAASKLAPFTPHLPQGSNLLLVQEEGKSAWNGQHLPKPPPASRPSDLAEPELTLLEDQADGAGRIVTLRLRSLRAAQRLVLRFDEAIAERVELVGAGDVAWRRPTKGVAVEAPPAEGVTFRMRFPLAVPVTGKLEDLTLGLPDSGAAVKAGRPAWAVPIHDGDRCVVRRAITF